MYNSDGYASHVIRYPLKYDVVYPVDIVISVDAALILEMSLQQVVKDVPVPAQVTRGFDIV